MTNVKNQFNNSKVLPLSRDGRKSVATVQVQQQTTFSHQISDVLAKYLKEHAEFDVRTKKDYHDHFRYLEKWADEEGLPLETMSHITKDLVMEYKNYLVSEYARSTVNIRLNTLRAFLRWCFEEEIIKEPLFLKLKKLIIDEESVRFLTEAQLEVLFQMANSDCYEGYRNYCIMLVLLDNGIRIKELLSVRWNMVDFENGEIMLPGSITKNGKQRKVPLLKDRTVPALQYLKMQNDLRFPGNEYLFLSYRGKQLDPSSVRHILRNYGRDAGIEGVSPHRFRHSFARFYVLSGGNMFMLQEILGHSTLEMSRRYVKLFSTEVANVHQQKSPLNRFAA